MQTMFGTNEIGDEPKIQITKITNRLTMYNLEIRICFGFRYFDFHYGER